MITETPMKSRNDFHLITTRTDVEESQKVIAQVKEWMLFIIKFEEL